MSAVFAALRRSRSSIASASHRGVARREARWAVAAGLATGVPLSGFNPFNNVVDVLGVPQNPALVVLTPPVLLGALALVAARLLPGPWVYPREVRTLLLGALLLTIASALSFTATDDIWYSILIWTMAILSPLALAVGVARSQLSAGVISGAFLLGCCLVLLRADVVFVQLHGFPTSDALFEAKYTNRPYDFHYYTLGNPGGTAAWLLMPLGLALFWSVGHSPLVHRLARLAAAALVGITLVLSYSRSALVVGIVLAIAMLLVLPWKPTLRYAVVGVFIAGILAVAMTGSIRSYLGAAVATDRASSSSVRILSIMDGWEVARQHPLTGVGLGRFNAHTGYVPAHSSVVQAAAETGFLGAAGLLLITISSAFLAVRRLRSNGLDDSRTAAAIAACVYLSYTVFTGGASEGLYSGYVPVWGLSVALFLGLAAGGDRAADDELAY